MCPAQGGGKEEKAGCAADSARGSQTLGTQASQLLPALPCRQLLTLLQGDEHTARQPALLEEPGQLRQELEHKPGPVRQPRVPAASSPNATRRRRQRSGAKPRAASLPRRPNAAHTCSLSSRTIPAPRAPLRQPKTQAIRPEVTVRLEGLPPLDCNSIPPIPASVLSPPLRPRACALGRPALAWGGGRIQRALGLSAISPREVLSSQPE